MIGGIKAVDNLLSGGKVFASAISLLNKFTYNEMNFYF
jgi:hypothetical protein